MLKIIDTKTYKTIHVGNCPVSNKSELTWVGFSEEGMFTIIDSYGVVSGFNFKNSNFLPLLDLKEKFPNHYRQIWTVGFLENEMLYVQMLKGEEQPPL